MEPSAPWTPFNLPEHDHYLEHTRKHLPKSAVFHAGPIGDALVKFVEDVLAASQSISKSHYVPEALSAIQLQTYMERFALPASNGIANCD